MRQVIDPGWQLLLLARELGEFKEGLGIMGGHGVHHNIQILLKGRALYDCR